MWRASKSGEYFGKRPKTGASRLRRRHRKFRHAAVASNDLFLRVQGASVSILGPLMRVPLLRLPRLGLRARLSLGMVAMVLLITLGVVTTALYFVKRDMQAAIANEEFERISAIAEAVDQKFMSRRTLLKSFGDSV